MSNPDKKPAVIVGAGKFAEVVSFYLTADSGYRPVAFVASDAAAPASFCGCPVVSFEDARRLYPPPDHEMFVAVAYKNLNRVRQDLCEQARAAGYRLLSYLCSKATHWGDTRLGDNVFVFEDNTLQPFVSIGDGTVLWSGNHIGHHSRIGNYCFLTSHVVISGNCVIGDRCFFGVNSTVTDDIVVAEDNLVGPGVVIDRSTGAGDAYLLERIKKYPKPSSRFFRW